MTKTFEPEKLKQFAKTVFEQYGFNANDSGTIASSLVDADMRGIASHGMQRLGMYVRKLNHGDILPDRHGTILKETASSVLIDGEHGMGQLIASQATHLAITKASQTGISVVSVRNSNHFGAAGYYVRQISRAGLIGISMTNTNPLTVPTHAKDAFLGSNPIAFGMPTETDDFVFDAATSTVSFGKFEVLMQRHQAVPGDWAIDETGAVTHDPGKLVANMQHPKRLGGVLPLGGLDETNAGYKGYGLTLLVEILTGVLAQGPLSVDMGSGQRGISHFFLALDPKLFGEPLAIKTRLSDLLNRLRALPPLTDAQPVLVPGDPEIASYRRHQTAGISLEDETITVLNTIANSLHLDAQQFEF
ncbi:Ldh family oxidoreductase [Secundilactobacillus paracollinoides]|uniref:Ldh family oxidoreductase n=1 Tax=Secundilactobacillus paracollinoides TaxID=240427 RepID=UPI0006F17E36|nr:Ldh family oxidoreductase [Secundilactobacillus paracollinoides]KRL77028.1 malate dehydrogenase [Secundilactobacillus paracollinoides DSM 15502 = JCM 11969]